MRIIIIMIVAVAIALSVTSPASAKASDLAKAKAWTHAHYKGKVVKVVNFGQVPECSKGIVYIAKVKTISKGGKVGKIRGTKYKVRYPKKVKKGKKVNVYWVYNPYGCGEVVAIVTCGKVWK